MNKFSLVSLVSFVFVALSAVACVGGPEDGNEAAAASVAGAAGTGGSSAGTGGSGGSGGNANKCDVIDCSSVGYCDRSTQKCVDVCKDTCPSGSTCTVDKGKATCHSGTGGSAGSGGTGGSSGSGGTAGTGGSGGSGGTPNACNTHNCGANQHCELNEQDAAVCLDDAVQQIDVVMANGCRAVLFDNLGSEVSNSSNGLDVHKAVNAGWAGWAMLTQQCSGQPYKSDWSPVGALASSTNAFTSIKVNGVEVKAHALICADKYGDPGGSKGWKKIAIPMSGSQWDKCPCALLLEPQAPSSHDRVMSYNSP